MISWENISIESVSSSQMAVRLLSRSQHLPSSAHSPPLLSFKRHFVWYTGARGRGGAQTEIWPCEKFALSWTCLIQNLSSMKMCQTPPHVFFMEAFGQSTPISSSFGGCSQWDALYENICAGKHFTDRSLNHAAVGLSSTETTYMYGVPSRSALFRSTRRADMNSILLLCVVCNWILPHLSGKQLLIHLIESRTK